MTASRLGPKTGERHHNARLTWDQVDEIRWLNASGEWTHQNLADKFGISRRTITHIVNNKRWVIDIDHPHPATGMRVK